MDNRPRGREKHITGQGKDIYRRGQGLGTGPVGNTGGKARTDTHRTSGGAGGRSTGGSSVKSKGIGGGVGILIVAVILFFVLRSCGGGNVDLSGLTDATDYSSGNSITSGLTQSLTGGDLSSLFSGYGSTSTGWSGTANTGALDRTVASGARAKYTQILGGGRDTVTIMVYMCGTDLESKSGMASADLAEMAAATLSDDVNILVLTGGCSQWKTSGISNTVNQIYKIERGGMRCLVQNAGSDSLVKPATLTSFIEYCAENYPANRNELIFWDHGGGSLSGYGYDEKNPGAGSMSLAGIDRALKDAGMKFDFIGFDACLMATLENALMLTDYADYLIASEETEPGVGWYYTNWLTNLSKDTSMATIDIGQNIVDDFVDVCNQRCAGQKTTLSVVDLAELSATVPDALRSWAADTVSLIQNNDYKAVSTARSNTREFAASSRIDQVDLVHLAMNLGTDDAEALADVLLGAVKYNRTSSSITDAYGLSIYFPYQRTSKVDSAVSTYNAIGMDSEYTRCIQQFASLGAAGQTVSGSVSGLSGSPLGSLLGGSTGGSLAGGDMISSLLGSLLSGGGDSFLGRSLDVESAADYIAANQFDANQLVWLRSGDGYAITLGEDQWSLVNDVELNVFYDDGEGFIDLGLDNLFTITDGGALVGDFDGSWLAIDGQNVAYYHTGTVDDGVNYTITGYVPILLNGERAQLLLVFDDAHPYGFIAGAQYDYRDGETETIAKSVTDLQEGDVIDFVCDYYSYDGVYLDSYMLGEAWTYHEDAEISNVYLPDPSRASVTYRFTDIYCQSYWTPVLP